jgi:hypothetical protein
MDRTRVDSDILRAVGYDRDTETLELEFVRGTIYRYFNVPPHVYESLMIAMSKGRYFQTQIEGQYRFVRVL